MCSGAQEIGSLSEQCFANQRVKEKSELLGDIVGTIGLSMELHQRRKIALTFLKLVSSKCLCQTNIVLSPSAFLSHEKVAVTN